MRKTLSERIAETVDSKQNPNPDKYRQKAIFLALRDEVAQAIEDGWPYKVIWETLTNEKKITFSYQTFRNYVNRFILEQSPIEKNKIDPSKDAIVSDTVIQNKQEIIVSPISEKKYPPTPADLKRIREKAMNLEDDY